MSKNAAHIKLKVAGNKKKIKLFFFMASKLDLDFPWGPFRRDRTKVDLYCRECDGFIYKYPLLDAEDLKKLARQINDSNRMEGDLKVRVVKFTKEPNCKAAPDLPEDTGKEICVYGI